MGILGWLVVAVTVATEEYEDYDSGSNNYREIDNGIIASRF